MLFLHLCTDVLDFSTASLGFAAATAAFCTIETVIHFHQRGIGLRGLGIRFIETGIRWSKTAVAYE